jgi:hypothetical protein
MCTYVANLRHRNVAPKKVEGTDHRPFPVAVDLADGPGAGDAALDVEQLEPI